VFSKIYNWFLEEIILKFNPKENEFEIGWIWIIILFPKFYLGLKTLINDLIWLFQ